MDLKEIYKNAILLAICIGIIAIALSIGIFWIGERLYSESPENETYHAETELIELAEKNEPYITVYDYSGKGYRIITMD